jgi:hypothetical protein
MPHATVCAKHSPPVLVNAGERCPACPADPRGAARRALRNVALGRTSAHWRRLSFRMIRRHRRTYGAICPLCATAEHPHDDPGSKLTVDLIGGGDHSQAREEDCRVLCRRCHGAADGGRR